MKENKFISDGDTFVLVSPAPASGITNDWEEVPRDTNGRWTDGTMAATLEINKITKGYTDLRGMSKEESEVVLEVITEEADEIKNFSRLRSHFRAMTW